MTYRNILVHVNQSARAAVRVELAASLAQRFDAHLVGVAPTGLAIVESLSGANAVDVYYADLARRCVDRAQAATRRFDETCRRAGVDSYEHRIANDEDAYAVSLHARYADLVVVGQNDESDPTIGTVPHFVEQVLISGGRPLLVVPYAGTFATVGKRVMLAWDASREAARATTDALPMLCGADVVRVVVVNGGPSPDGHGETPGADVAQYLARHGVNVEVRDETTSLDVASVLLSRAADDGTDLIVMGGYGHSRFREMLMGGVTRSMLETMTVPVLMSH